MEMKIMGLLQNKKQWILVLLVGVLLLVIAIPTESENHESTVTMDHNQQELRLQKTLEHMTNVGNVHVMITYREENVVEGIVILAEGASNAVVKREITEVVQALFDVKVHKIKVIEGISIQ